jgi:aminoglycoside 6'-N-acetyltransferase
VVITFEPLTRERFALLGRWLAEPHVRRWWAHDPSPAAVEADFGPTVDGREPAEDHVVLVDGRPVGLVQFCRLADQPDYVEELAAVLPVESGAASIDYLIGEPSMVGRGVGTAVIAAFVERTWDREPAVTHLVVPVNAGNVASWRAVEKAGFRRGARGGMETHAPRADRMHQIPRLEPPPPAT